jgi:hypothetical protein
MKNYRTQSATFNVTASEEQGVNTIAIHVYDDESNNVGDVKIFDYESDEDPTMEDFSTIENALASINIEADIQEQDSNSYMGLIITAI